MKLPNYFQKELVSELRNIAKRMKVEKDIRKQLYYYSAAHGITTRTYRFHFDPELLFVDFVFNASYNMMWSRAQLIRVGDLLVPLTSAMIVKVAECVEDVATCIEKGKELYEPLQQIIMLAFSTTGPGNYLVETGQMKIE